MSDDQRTPTDEIDLMKALVEAIQVPPLIKNAIDNYVAGRHRPGGFVVSVLKNDLKGACARGDYASLRALPVIVAYCYNEIPAPCWGSHEIVEAWVSPEQEDESITTTTQRARREGLRRIISDHRSLLRVETDEGQRFQVTGVEEDPELVIIAAARGVPG